MYVYTPVYIYGIYGKTIDILKTKYQQKSNSKNRQRSRYSEFVRSMSLQNKYISVVGTSGFTRISTSG